MNIIHSLFFVLKVFVMVYFFDGVRLPIGKRGGIYKEIIPEKLGAFLINELLRKHPSVISEIQEIIIANSIGIGGNIGRYTSLLSALPKSIPTSSIDMQCGGGLKAIQFAYHSIKDSTHNSFVLCGGIESNSLRPSKNYHPKDTRYQQDIKDVEVVRFSEDQKNDLVLLEAANLVAEKFEITKFEMLDWVVESHKKLGIAFQIESYHSGIVSMKSSNTDQAYKQKISLDQLLRASTKNLIDFTTSSHFNDGAAMLLLSNKSQFNLESPKSDYFIRSTVCIGGDPNYSPEAPIWAIDQLLKKENLKIEEIDILEINESFAVKPLVVSKYFKFNKEKINIFGGNMAYGHPYAASGVINFLSLIAALKFTNKKRGIVAGGAAGGLGIAILVEKVV